MLIIRRPFGRSLMSSRPIYAYLEVGKHNKPSWILDPKRAIKFADPRVAALMARKWGGEITKS